MPYTLLLADDSVTIQRVIELTFADEDVTVVAVSDGDQAIERLEASPIDIVLADIGMPGKNGYEVAQYMRRSPALAHIPVMLLTGAFEPVDQARANEAGCDGVLAKPFEPQLVISRVKELLARARRPESPGPDLNVTGAGGEFSLPPLAPRVTPSADSIWAPPLAEQRAVAPLVDPPTAEAATGPVPRAELNDYFDRLDAAFSSLSSNAPARPIADPPPPALTTEIDWFATAAAEAPRKEPWDLPAPAAGIAPADLPLTHAAEPPPEAAFGLVQLEQTWAPPAVTEPASEEPAAGPDERLAPIEESAPLEEPAPIEESAPLEEPAPVEEPAPAEKPAAIAAPAPIEPGPPPAEEPAAHAWAAPVPHAPAWPSAPALELPLPNPPPLPALADAFAALLAAEQGEALTDTTGTWPAAPAPVAPPAAVVVTDELLEDVTRRVLARLSDTVVREAVADIASKVAERLIREEIERIKASIK